MLARRAAPQWGEQSFIDRSIIQQMAFPLSGMSETLSALSSRFVDPNPQGPSSAATGLRGAGMLLFLCVLRGGS
jgi:hypothetical protein